MTTAIIKRCRDLGERIDAPPSKSYTHRAVIAAFLSQGSSAIRGPSGADDCLTTLRAVRAYGARVREGRKELIVEGVGALSTPDDVIDCGGSGSTIRFMTPIASHAPGISVLTGNGSLRRRPMGPLLDSLRELGVTCYSARGDGRPPIIVMGGGLRGGRTSIPGDVSSQYISGLIFAGGRAGEDVSIGVTTPLESKPYVALTLQVARAHGGSVEASTDLRSITVHPSAYSSKDHRVPGDYSGAAFLMAAAAICDSELTVRNLQPNSGQGDEGILGVLRSMGAQVQQSDGAVAVRGGELRATTVDAADMPDSVPVCAALACYARGRTEVRNAKRLRIKESDRLASTRMELRKMGARIREREDGLIIEGPAKLKGAAIDPHDDHRIAMACAIAALGARGVTRITNAQCVSKSYPNFFNDLKKLGVDVDAR